MRYFYLDYIDQLFVEFGLPKNLIEPVIQLIENSRALCLKHSEFRDILKNNDVSNPEVVVKLNQILTERIAHKSSAFDDLCNEYPILSPEHFPPQVAREIIAAYEWADAGSGKYLEILRKWMRAGHYIEQIRLYAKLRQDHDDRLWWHYNMPGPTWTEKEQLKGVKTDV